MSSDSRARAALTRAATLRMRLEIDRLTRALVAANAKTFAARTAMTARELHHALLKVGEPLADCKIVLDLGGMYADVLGVKWGGDDGEWYVELELGTVRLRREP